MIAGVALLFVLLSGALGMEKATARTYQVLPVRICGESLADQEDSSSDEEEAEPLPAVVALAE